MSAELTKCQVGRSRWVRRMRPPSIARSTVRWVVRERRPMAHLAGPYSWACTAPIRRTTSSGVLARGRARPCAVQRWRTSTDNLFIRKGEPQQRRTTETRRTRRLHGASENKSKGEPRRHGGHGGCTEDTEAATEKTWSGLRSANGGLLRSRCFLAMTALSLPLV